MAEHYGFREEMRKGREIPFSTTICLRVNRLDFEVSPT